MDGFIVTIWIVRLLFLALLYLFLFAVARALLRDLRARAGSRAELGRLVVVASPAASRRRARSSRSTPSRRSGRDVNNAIVVDDQFASARARRPDVPRPGLVRRGPRQHQRHVLNGAPVEASRRWATATRSSSARSGCASSAPR